MNLPHLNLGQQASLVAGSGSLTKFSEQSSCGSHLSLTQTFCWMVQHPELTTSYCSPSKSASPVALRGGQSTHSRNLWSIYTYKIYNYVQLLTTNKLWAVLSAWHHWNLLVRTTTWLHHLFTVFWDWDTIFCWTALVLFRTLLFQKFESNWAGLWFTCLSHTVNLAV